MERPEHEAMATPARVLYVVARDRLDLYAALLEAFVESPRLGIVLDRRSDVHGTRKRSVDRRHLVLDELLRTRGWARIRVEPNGRVMLADEDDSTGKGPHGRRSDR